MCSSSCLTGNHKTWGECIRSKGLRIAYCQSASGKDFSAQKAHDSKLEAYADARRQGIQPPSTNLSDVRQAVDISNSTGTAFEAN